MKSHLDIIQPIKFSRLKDLLNFFMKLLTFGGFNTKIEMNLYV